jgi:lipopolysaccharide export system protein LptC
MAAEGKLYSRFVAWAKVLLPLGALGLLATLFLIARQIDPDAAIPFAEIDVERFAREARIGAPEFSGVTEDGTVIALTAELARPDPAEPGRMTAERLAAEFEVPDGSRVTAVARQGAVDSPAQRIELRGGVEVTTSTGYRVETEGLWAALDRTSLASTGPVEAEGPPGRIAAEAMEMTQDPEHTEAYVLVFKGGVRLIYEPGN